MPAHTSRLRIPYPTANEKLSDYPTTSKQSAETVENAILAAAPLSPSPGRIGSPPSGATLRTVAWAQTVRTNQFGQAALTLPEGIAGIKDCVVSLATFDTDDSQAFGESITVTGKSGATPIVTVSRAGTRQANATRHVMVIGVGWTD